MRHMNEWTADILAKCCTSPVLFPARHKLRLSSWDPHKMLILPQLSLLWLIKHVYPCELPWESTKGKFFFRSPQAVTHHLPPRHISSFPTLAESESSFLTVLIRRATEEKVVRGTGLGFNIQISQPQNQSLPLRYCDRLLTNSVIGVRPWIIFRCHGATVLIGHHVPTAITW